MSARRLALVTGGASGLGDATVQALLERGWSVAVLDTDAEQVERLERQAPERTLAAAADVCSEAAVQRVIDAAVARFGELRLCVNAAGIGEMGPTLGDDGPLPMARFRRLFEVNVFGTFNVARLAAASMARNTPDDAGERGHIVNVSSVSAYQPLEGTVAYSASKAAVAALTRPMAHDLARHGIRVNAVAPGLFDTPMLGSLPPALKAQLAASIPFPSRCGRPEEFAAVVASLLDNRYFNGAVLRLDGAAR